jgi:hypothetical protein
MIEPGDEETCRRPMKKNGPAPVMSRNKVGLTNRE